MTIASAIAGSASDIRLIRVGEVITSERPTNKCSAWGTSAAAAGGTAAAAGFWACVAAGAGGCCPSEGDPHRNISAANKAIPLTLFILAVMPGSAIEFSHGVLIDLESSWF